MHKITIEICQRLFSLEEGLNLAPPIFDKDFLAVQIDMAFHLLEQQLVLFVTLLKLDVWDFRVRKADLDLALHNHVELVANVACK